MANAKAATKLGMQYASVWQTPDGSKYYDRISEEAFTDHALIARPEGLPVDAVFIHGMATEILDTPSTLREDGTVYELCLFYLDENQQLDSVDLDKLTFTGTPGHADFTVTAGLPPWLTIRHGELIRER